MPHAIAFRLLLACTCAVSGMALASDPPTTAKDACVTEQVTISVPATPISTRAALDAYMRDTPAARSPLNWLTSGGQRRFLAGIVFSERGIAGMSLDDVRYELTREQAYELLRLFDAQAYATSLDARTTPLPASTAADISRVEQAYDRLLAISLRGDDQRSPAMVESYRTDFARWQNDAQRHALDDRDVELMFRAVGVMLEGTDQPGYLADMQGNFAELQRRHAVDRPHAGMLYDALLRAHRSDEAKTLGAAYPVIDRRPPPTMRSGGRVRKGQRSLWILTPGKRELLRYRFVTHMPAQVVVVASPECHFSQDAARDIEADPQLRDIFGDASQWVAPSSDFTAFDAVQRWNTQHPAVPLAIAYDDTSLPAGGPVGTPTFYFLQRGRVVDTVVGWPRKGSREAIRLALRRIGLDH